MRDILEYVDEWTREGEEIALATVVGAAGSTPRPVGAWDGVYERFCRLVAAEEGAQ